MIIVANVKTYRIGDAAPGATVVYIGRAMPGRPGSVLGNPFKLQRGESREACLLKYRRWLRDLPADSPQWQEIARLVEIARNGDLVLLCWCAPEKCHGDHLKEVIEEGLKRPQISEIPATDGPVRLSSVWEVPDAKALDLMTTDRDFWRSTFEDCAADGFSAVERVIAERIVAISEECDDLREKARLFDVLAAAVARTDSTDWEIYHGIESPVVIYLRRTGECVHGATLAEAVTKAMEAEGKR